MADIDLKGLFYLVSTSAFLLWEIAIFLFNRISVRHNEREMLKEGIEAPNWDKGLGLRVVDMRMLLLFLTLIVMHQRLI